MIFNFIFRITKRLYLLVVVGYPIPSALLFSSPEALTALRGIFPPMRGGREDWCSVVPLLLFLNLTLVQQSWTGFTLVGVLEFLGTNFACSLSVAVPALQQLLRSGALLHMGGGGAAEVVPKFGDALTT